VDLDLDLDLRIGDLDLDLDLAVAGLVTSLTITKVNLAFHPFGVGESSTSLSSCS